MVHKLLDGAIYSALLFLAATNTSAAATYYVAPTGKPTNNGSAGAPWRQIRNALPRLAPGDTVLVADGSYKGFTMDDIHGTPSLPITIKASGPNVVVTKTTDRSDNRDTIKISFCSYIVIDGLTAFKATRAALRADASHFITVRNCAFGNNANWGIFTNHSNNLVIEGNVCYGSVSEHGIYVSNSAANPTVRGNVCYNNRGCGLHFNGDISAGGGDGLITGALVEKNILFGNGAGGGSAINMDGPRNCTIRNNLIYNNFASGIALFRIDAADGPSGVNVYCNTIDMPTNGRWGVHIGSSGQDVGKIVLRDNILKHRNAGRGSIEYFSTTDVANTDSDYNVIDKVTPNDGNSVYTLAQWKARGHELHSLSATNAALFVNADGGDYHLRSNSPALRTGQPVSVFDDLEGRPRPAQGLFDIGCYQLSQ